jgi:transcriptional regulator with XRE-family HTH domain
MMPANTFPANIPLCKPKNGERIPNYTIAYLNERHRNTVHSFILDCLRKSGITQAELARRLGKAPELINRKIGAPGNWTLDSVSELLFAINGCEPHYTAHDFLCQARTNYGPPEWLHQEEEKEENIADLRSGQSVQSATEAIGILELEEA